MQISISLVEENSNIVKLVFIIETISKYEKHWSDFMQLTFQKVKENMWFKTASIYYYFEENNNVEISQHLNCCDFTINRDLDEEELLGFGIENSSNKIYYGEFESFGNAWARLNKFEKHNCLQIYFSSNHFIDLLDENDEINSPLTNSNLKPLLSTFRNSCETLNPVFAFIDTLGQYGDDNWEINLGSVKSAQSIIENLKYKGSQFIISENFWLVFLSYKTQLEKNLTLNSYTSFNCSNGKIFFTNKL
ncbi:MAG: hypothetical protein QM535_13235 [Limnohabitans sp.]|nr:hypothetical protein [Limnohabitans sp.]